MLIEYDFTLEHINLSTCHDLSGEPLGQNLLCSRGASFSLLRKIPARKITSRCPTFCLRSHILRESEIKRGARARYTHAWKYRRGCVWRRAARGLELRPLFILRCGKVLPFGAKFGAHAARVQNRASRLAKRTAGGPTRTRELWQSAMHARSDAPDQQTGPPHSTSKIWGLSLRRASQSKREAHSSFWTSALFKLLSLCRHRT